MRAIMNYSAILLMAAAAACGGGSDGDRERQMEESAQRHGIDADVELDEDGEVKSVEIKGHGGARTGLNISLPDDFPADAPVSDDWSVITVAPAPQGGYMVQATSSGPAADAMAFIKREYPAHGWTQTAEAAPAPIMQQIAFEKDDRMTNISVIESGDTVTVQILTGPKLY